MAALAGVSGDEENCLGDSEGDRQDSVGAQLSLVVGAIQRLAHEVVDLLLLDRILALRAGGERRVTMWDQHAASRVPGTAGRAGSAMLACGNSGTGVARWKRKQCGWRMCERKVIATSLHGRGSYEARKDAEWVQTQPRLRDVLTRGGAASPLLLQIILQGKGECGFRLTHSRCWQLDRTAPQQ